MKRKILAAGVAIALSIGLGSCTTVGQLLASAGQTVATATTSAPPNQAVSVARAIQSLQLVEDGLDVYVRTAKPDKATLDEIQILVTALHNSLQAAEHAQAVGADANVVTALAAFNEGLAALKAYETQKGVSQ